MELLKNKYASKYGKDNISQIVLVDSVASTFDAISIYAVDFIPEPPWKYAFFKKEMSDWNDALQKGE